jgi:hypothetical protein
VVGEPEFDVRSAGRVVYSNLINLGQSWIASGMVNFELLNSHPWWRSVVLAAAYLLVKQSENWTFKTALLHADRQSP